MNKLDLKSMQKKFDDKINLNHLFEFKEAYRLDKRETLNILRSSFTANLSSIRSFLYMLVSISIAVIGVFIATYSFEFEIFKNQILGLIGVVILFITTLLTIIYLKNILINENETLNLRYKFFEESFDKNINLIQLYLKQLKTEGYIEKAMNLEGEILKNNEEMTKKTKEEISDINHLLIDFFILGLLLLGISLLNISWSWAILIILIVLELLILINRYIHKISSLLKKISELIT